MEWARTDGGNGGVRLPIGFRFHPTDEELLIHYLKRKVLSMPLPSTVIPELEEVFQFNPWDLPGELKEKRYFFCKRKRNSMNKCSSSFSTDCGGYWKSSGKEKQIMVGESNHVIGIKKSFAFYQGRKLKTQWIMQEFSLVGSLKTPFLHQRLLMQVGDWVVCRLFERKRRARNQGRKKSWDCKNKLGLSFDETTSSGSSGITEVSSCDLGQEASTPSVFSDLATFPFWDVYSHLATFQK